MTIVAHGYGLSGASSGPSTSILVDLHTVTLESAEVDVVLQDDAIIITLDDDILTVSITGGEETITLSADGVGVTLDD